MVFAVYLPRKQFTHYHKNVIKNTPGIFPKRGVDFVGFMDNDLYISEHTFLAFSLGAIWK